MTILSYYNNLNNNMWTYFTDTDTDISPEVASEYGYKLISMPYNVDAKPVYPYVSYSEFDSKAFYDMLRSGVLPTTAAISEEEYIKYFEPEFAAGNDIFYVHFSAAMTMTFGNMYKALDVLKAKYPGRKFLEVDTKGITIISYLIVREIGDMLKAGKTPEEIVVWAETGVDRYCQYFFADDLKFFRRSGRVSGIAATMGGLIGIRPIIHMDSAGKMVSIGKEKGRQNALNRLVSYVEEMGDNIKGHRFIIGHTDAPELAEQMASLLKARFGDDLQYEFVVTNPTAGSHCGPNGVGVAFHSKCR
ncbi:MAG: DegV family protein [Bacteroidales bacterium]|nr:DegV family protein [Bacteroidales bacterium]